MEEGILGLTKIMRSNKLEAQSITNYTKIIFKDRLEILQSFKGVATQYEEIQKIYPEVINLANKYYDLVLVDLGKRFKRKYSRYNTKKFKFDCNYN